MLGADVLPQGGRKPAEGALCADVLVLGAGPAGLAIAAALAEQGVAVALLCPGDPQEPWPNTYGVWGDEVDALGLGDLLEHRWQHTVNYSAPDPPMAPTPPMPRRCTGGDYGLFDKLKLQRHWLEQLRRSGVPWHRGEAVAVEGVADEAGRAGAPPGAAAW